jgi:hypothetical protein
MNLFSDFKNILYLFLSNRIKISYAQIQLRITNYA